MSPKLGLSESEIRLRYNEELIDLKSKIVQSQRALEEYKASHGSIAVLMDAIKDEVKLLPVPKAVAIVNQKKNKVETPCGVCFLISDSHYGAVQNKSEVEGFGEYSPELCESRSYEYIRRAVNWVTVHRMSYKVDTAYVLVAGDLISGDILLELQVTNAFPSPVQTVGTAKILSNQISELSRHFKNVVVHFVTEDNHARLTKKPQAKEAGLNSFNYIVGELSKIMLKDHKNVEFNIYPQYEVVVNVEGRRYLLMHGHGVSGWMGFPYYGIERKVSKEAFKRMNGPDATKFHRVIMGHWHAPMAHPLFWIGGSVQGTDAYDHKAGRHAEPSQAAWFVHPKYGEFDRTDFGL